MRWDVRRQPISAAVVLAAAAAGIAAAPTGCGQIIGADKDRVPLPETEPETGTAEQPPPAPKCPEGQKVCPSGACASLDDPAFGCSDPSCTPCSLPFTNELACQAGACTVATCSPGHADCNLKANDGCEADLSEAATCGDCRKSCGTDTPFCNGGLCVKTCEPPTTLCVATAKCADLTLDYKNCGLCGNECPGDAQGRVNADPVCTSSQCGITCRATYGDCDNNKANGCEASLVAYFVDADGDGIGVKVASPAGFACAPPPGNATTNTDCNDDPMHDGKDVFPGQTRYFAVGYTTAMGTSSYDYNCDTVESVEGAQIGKCTPCSPGSAADSVHAASPYCGSTTALVCNSAVCASQSHAAWRCH